VLLGPKDALSGVTVTREESTVSSQGSAGDCEGSGPCSVVP
jgi:hypothetical protein